jgi:hypothetical protein
MKRTSTEKYLTLGMALYADRTPMELRVRGVFARKKSARAVKLLALLLCVTLGVGCFTTACKATTAPAASDGNAIVASDGNAGLATAGNATSGNAEAAVTHTYTKEEALRGRRRKCRMRARIPSPE